MMSEIYLLEKCDIQINHQEEEIKKTYSELDVFQCKENCKNDQYEEDCVTQCNLYEMQLKIYQLNYYIIVILGLVVTCQIIKIILEKKSETLNIDDNRIPGNVTNIAAIASCYIIFFEMIMWIMMIISIIGAALTFIFVLISLVDYNHYRTRYINCANIEISSYSFQSYLAPYLGIINSALLFIIFSIIVYQYVDMKRFKRESKKPIDDYNRI